MFGDGGVRASVVVGIIVAFEVSAPLIVIVVVRSIHSSEINCVT